MKKNIDDIVERDWGEDEMDAVGQAEERRCAVSENVIKLVLLVLFVFAFLACLAHGERTFRGRMLAACPSGTALRVCDETDARLEKEAFGRICVRFRRLLAGADGTGRRK